MGEVNSQNLGTADQWKYETICWLAVIVFKELFYASQQDVSYHINQIYTEGEQNPERTHKIFVSSTRGQEKSHQKGTDRLVSY